jgi:threonyl-tRNA synthetase
VHRNELSGVLAGLFRLRYFTQDDTHIFVTPEQLEDEIVRVVDIADYFYKKFNLDYHVEFSTRPEKKMGSDEIWDKAESALENALGRKKYKVNPGEGAFYGPKIDFHIKDSLGRTWQCATIQVDFMMPERFDVNYIGEDNKPHRPVIIHRVIYGAIERFMGILTEHYNGAFPVWLAPVQARVISFTDRNVDTAKKVFHKLVAESLRADSDFRPATVDYKVREAEVQRIPYIIVIGDKEEKNNTLAVRKRGGKPEFGVKLEDFLKKIKEEIEEMK